MAGQSPASGAPDAVPFRRPQVRLRADIGTWTYGEPLATGGGEASIDIPVTDLLMLHQILGPDGFEAFLHVIRHAQPMPTEEGGIRLELPGFSARWLKETCGFGERASLRAAAALRDSGLVVIASMPGARGTEGKQRAILTGLAGIDDDTSDVVETRRGRGSRAARRTPRAMTNPSTGPSVLTNVQNRGSDGSAVSPESPEPRTFSQVSTVLTEPQKGTTKEGVGRSTSLGPSRARLASLDGGQADDAATLVGDGPQGTEVWMLSTAASWEDLRDTLSRKASAGQVDLFGALRPIIGKRSAAAGQVVKTLRLAGESSVADRLTGYLVAVLTSHGGRTSAVWRVLIDAGVHLPDEPVEVLGPRLVAAIAAGLDAKTIENWCGWLGHGLRKPSSKWTPTPTLRMLATAIEQAYLDQPAPAQVAAERDESATEPAPTPSAVESDAAPVATAESNEAPPPPTRPDKRTAPAAGAASPEIEEHLPAAVAWAAVALPDSPYVHLGVEGLRKKPRFAHALVGLYLADLPSAIPD